LPDDERCSGKQPDAVLITRKKEWASVIARETLLQGVA
jgi:hypothetical protein